MHRRSRRRSAPRHRRSSTARHRVDRAPWSATLVHVNDILIQVRGNGLVRGSATPIVLRGVGLGGWMNMENFITGYPASESQQRAALRDALGETGYRRFFDRSVSYTHL